MKSNLTKLLHRLTSQRMKEMFPEATVKVFDTLPKGFPSTAVPVEEARKLLAKFELMPPDCCCWILNREDAVKLFLVLLVSPKADRFTFEIAWSTNGRLPHSKMLEPGEEGDSNELRFRLGRLWGADTFDEWWFFGRKRTPIDAGAGVPDDPLDVKLADVEPKVEAALCAVKKYAVPYLGNIAKRYGVRLVTQ